MPSLARGARAGAPARRAIVNQAAPRDLVGVLALPGLDPFCNPIPDVKLHSLVCLAASSLRSGHALSRGAGGRATEPVGEGVSAHAGDGRCRVSCAFVLPLHCLAPRFCPESADGTLHDGVRQVGSSKLTARVRLKGPHRDRNGLALPTSSAEQRLRRGVLKRPPRQAPGRTGSRSPRSTSGA